MLEEDLYFGYHLANVLPSSLVSVYDAEEYHRLHSRRSDGARRVWNVQRERERGEFALYVFKDYRLVVVNHLLLS